ncbi:DUF6011 domain-containing protein [Salibacterium halotolerans]|uniref:DUF6011 domain-containing protein n=1 Tax=Salibacterium halotolerans TaxID=1884432 RepID=UPI003CC7AC7C
MRCGRSLTDSISRVRGYGPICWIKSQESIDLIDSLQKLNGEDADDGTTGSYRVSPLFQSGRLSMD